MISERKSRAIFWGEFYFIIIPCSLLAITMATVAVYGGLREILSFERVTTDTYAAVAGIGGVIAIVAGWYASLTFLRRGTRAWQMIRWRVWVAFLPAIFPVLF
ncbi:MAG: hypothetical protein ABIY40_07035 [Rhodanobacteraceae bacterium]